MPTMETVAFDPPPSVLNDDDPPPSGTDEHLVRQGAEDVKQIRLRRDIFYQLLSLRSSS